MPDCSPLPWPAAARSVIVSWCAECHQLLYCQLLWCGLGQPQTSFYVVNHPAAIVAFASVLVQCFQLSLCIMGVWFSIPFISLNSCTSHMFGGCPHLLTLLHPYTCPHLWNKHHTHFPKPLLYIVYLQWSSYKLLLFHSLKLKHTYSALSSGRDRVGTFRFPIDYPSQFAVWLLPLQLTFCFVLAVIA